MVDQLEDTLVDDAGQSQLALPNHGHGRKTRLTFFLLNSVVCLGIAK